MGGGDQCVGQRIGQGQVKAGCCGVGVGRLEELRQHRPQVDHAVGIDHRAGQGREGGLAAALDYTRTKTVWLRTSDDPIPDPFVMR